MTPDKDAETIGEIGAKSDGSGPTGTHTNQSIMRLGRPIKSAISNDNMIIRSREVSMVFQPYSKDQRYRRSYQVPQE